MDAHSSTADNAEPNINSDDSISSIPASLIPEVNSSAADEVENKINISSSESFETSIFPSLAAEVYPSAVDKVDNENIPTDIKHIV